MKELFYFLCYPRGDKSKIKVIDECENLRYEKNDYSIVNDLEWYNARDAIEYARKLAEQNNLTYEPFDSRYGEDDENDFLYLK